MQLLRLKEDLPIFIGSDSRQYGAYSKNDIVKLPEKDAGMLIEQGYAKEL